MSLTINIRGYSQYVWVLTDRSHVVFRLTPTREARFIQDILRPFQGVVVSDFYAGYDAVNCQQQKCLVHLVRDLNDELWKHPFNEEYTRFTVAVRDLLGPIFEDVQRFGLKVFHFSKHKRRVDRFYREQIEGHSVSSEPTATFKKRFERYRHSLWTFLERDGVPWNNNAAERAIRHLAVQRKISGAFSTTGASQYLRLLAIAQTCRFQNKSFLGFLLSKLQDVDAYKVHRRRWCRSAGLQQQLVFEDECSR